jgi:hypothetical protein
MIHERLHILKVGEREHPATRDLFIRKGLEVLLQDDDRRLQGHEVVLLLNLEVVSLLVPLDLIIHNNRKIKDGDFLHVP